MRQLDDIPIDDFCPFCRHELELATHLGPATEKAEKQVVPRTGDHVMCINCGEFSIYEDGHLRKPTDAEYAIIGESRELRRVRGAWQKSRAEMAAHEKMAPTAVHRIRAHLWLIAADPMNPTYEEVKKAVANSFGEAAAKKPGPPMPAIIFDTIAGLGADSLWKAIKEIPETRMFFRTKPTEGQDDEAKQKEESQDAL